MTKDEIMALLDKRIIDADEQAKIFAGNDSYFTGIQEGLRQAKELVGMLDKKNKASNDLILTQEKTQKLLEWQTGEPTEGGRYLMTMKEAGAVSTATFIPGDAHDEHFFKEYITAWCKLSDIEPYRER